MLLRLVRVLGYIDNYCHEWVRCFIYYIVVTIDYCHEDKGCGFFFSFIYSLCDVVVYLFIAFLGRFRFIPTIRQIVVLLFAVVYNFFYWNKTSI